jgi:hypothetical protein
MGNSACTARNASPNAVGATPVQPEDRTEPLMVSSRKLDCQLSLADSAKSMKHKYFLSLVLSLWQKRSFELHNLSRSIHKRLHFGDSFKAEDCAIFPNNYTK